MRRQVVLDNIRFDRQLLLKLTHLFSNEEGTSLLYSGGNLDSSQHSYLFLFPFDFVWVQGKKQWRGKREDPDSKLMLAMENPWEALKTLLPSFDESNPVPEWVGFFGYEMGASADLGKPLQAIPATTPDAYLQRCAIVLAVDHQKEEGTLFVSDQSRYFLDEQNRHWVDRLSDKALWPEFVESLSPIGHATSDTSLELIGSVETQKSYIDKILHAKELISAGDIYQVNLSQQFTLQGKRHPFHLFHQLATLNPSPFSAYLQMEDYAIVSSSPERFLCKRDSVLETRPIKGTAPRGSTAEIDQLNKENLLNSPKEKAELLMITDLMRNDLGKVSLPGSVNTEDIWRCEAYANVFHLISIIRSQVLPLQHPLDIIRSCYPGGSITGCPKLSAMEVISDLEKRPRGIYTGTIGYFAENGDFDFNIAIRTITVLKDRLEIQLGGAVVADSDPELEYQETLHKGASIFQTLGLDIK